MRFQFPYCAWEFNNTGSNTPSKPSWFQFPYCAWEFNGVDHSCIAGSTGFNSHTVRGSSTWVCWQSAWLALVSIPILCVGVQHFRRKIPAFIRWVSIPILCVGVQLDYVDPEVIKKLVSIPILCVGVQPLVRRLRDKWLYTFQFPYCAWEFNMKINLLITMNSCFNSHTARGSSTNIATQNIIFFNVSIPILRVGVQHRQALNKRLIKLFQFPYCAWEFNGMIQAPVFDSLVSIPILRVGVQLC